MLKNVEWNVGRLFLKIHNTTRLWGGLRCVCLMMIKNDYDSNNIDYALSFLWLINMHDGCMKASSCCCFFDYFYMHIFLVVNREFLILEASICGDKEGWSMMDSKLHKSFWFSDFSFCNKTQHNVRISQLAWLNWVKKIVVQHSPQTEVNNEKNSDCTSFHHHPAIKPFSRYCIRDEIWNNKNKKASLNCGVECGERIKKIYNERILQAKLRLTSWTSSEQEKKMV